MDDSDAINPPIVERPSHDDESANKRARENAAKQATPRATGIGASVYEDESVPSEDTLRGLERVLASSSFIQSTRLSRFLRYTVEQTLQGQASGLKEYTIGVNAYGRRSDFDPSQDTIVRTEARRLRRKLQEYYENDGRQDEVVIFFRSGSYVPVIRWRKSIEEPVLERKRAEDLFVPGDGIWVSVVRFQTAASDSLAESFAFGVSEEIIDRLVLLPGIRVISEDLSSQTPEASDDADRSTPKAQIWLTGSVRRESSSLRVHARVTTADGHVLWSQRFDAPVEGLELMRLQESVASAFLSGIAPRETLVRRHMATPTRSLYVLYTKVLAAETLLEEGSTQSIEAALIKFEELIATAPDYARLYCGASQCCVALAQRGARSDEPLAVRAAQLARRAIALDEEIVDGYASLGCALAQQWQWKAAEASFRKGIGYGSQHTIHRQFALFLMTQLRFTEAWENLKISQALDPFSKRQKSSVARFFFLSQRHEEGERFYAETTHLGQLPLEATFFRALTALSHGEVAPANRVVDGVLRLANASLSYLAAAAELLALAGEKVRADELCKSYAMLKPEAKMAYFRKASLALALGDSALAIEMLEASLHAKEAELPWLKVDPRFSSLREDKSFLAVERAVFGESDAG